MAQTTKFGTQYFSMDAYKEDKKGIKKLAKGLKELPSAMATAPKDSGPTSDLVQMFISAGLPKTRAEETERNAALSTLFKDYILKADAAGNKVKGLLLYEVASMMSKPGDGSAWIKPYSELLVGYIKSNKLKTKVQLEAAFKFLKGCPVEAGKEITKLNNEKEFIDATGIGIEITEEDVAKAVAAAIEAKKEKVLADRYRITFVLMAEVRENLKFADGSVLKKQVDSQLESLLGPKTEADLAKPKKEKKAKKDKKASKDKPKDNAVAAAEEASTGASLKFHKPGENYTTSGYVVTENTMKHMAAHLKRTGGQIRTRFPPEPNGVLHIGHAKAINFNFSYAAKNGGITYLRYDDTNPEKEEERFFTGIKENVEWLGWKPCAITHSSDYFQELYELAVKLIKSGDAYVCHQQADELKGHETRKPSPWQNRPIEESLLLFDDMKNGKIDEGKATLRMKHTMKDGKIDPVAYRIKFKEHHRTKDKWCIYPTYDYTHCLCDSFEDITHSLCTKEFQNRRPSYYWLCNAVDVYCPVQWEYSRLNVGYAVVSKRKIAKLIDGGFVADWDDPRLMTLSALRRRGFPPEALTNFVEKVGVTESTETMIDPSNVEACVRDVMNEKCTRAMAVLDPIRVELTSTPDGFPSVVSVPNHPTYPEKGTHDVPVCKVLYIERDDFNEAGPKDFKRLTPTQPVGIKYLNMVIKVEEVIKTDGVVTTIKASGVSSSTTSKPKGWVQWVSSSSPDVKPMNAEVRVYRRLFQHAEPEKVEGGFLKDINSDSLTTYHNAFVDDTVKGAKIEDSFQFERSGFYCVDRETTDAKMVFNLTVELRGK